MSVDSDSESQAEIKIIKPNESKQQNDILNRREARRRKILENAKSRLEKLSGEDSRASNANRCSSYSAETYSDPEIDQPEIINNYSPTYKSPLFENTPNHEDWEFRAKPPTKFEKILSTRMHIVASSPFTYLMLVCGLSVFIPHVLFLFLTLECIELIAYRSDKPPNVIGDIMLLLCGINLSKARVPIKVFGLLSKLASDLGLFVFAFAMTHGLYTWLVKLNI